MSRRLALGLLCSWAVLAGCSSSSPVTVQTPLDPTQEKLIKIKLAYSHFLGEKGAPPRSAEDLRPLLASGADNPDEILRSSRDAQPFVICWGVDINAKLPWAKTTPVLAYEKEGVGGSRWVLTTARSVGLMSEQEFREASFPPGYSGVSQ
jgi:hypothetical protein